MSRTPPGRRADYRYFSAVTTRWRDNDMYGHMNNAVYFSFFDTAVSHFEVERNMIDYTNGDVIGVAAETTCRYFSELGFPDRVLVGLRVGHLGRSSVRYEMAMFRNDDDIAAAEGHFVNVFVDRATMRPVPIPDAMRAILQTIAVSES